MCFNGLLRIPWCKSGISCAINAFHCRCISTREVIVAVRTTIMYYRAGTPLTNAFLYVSSFFESPTSAFLKISGTFLRLSTTFLMPSATFQRITGAFLNLSVTSLLLSGTVQRISASVQRISASFQTISSGGKD
jgi:hypothetical protein